MRDHVGVDACLQQFELEITAVHLHVSCLTVLWCRSCTAQARGSGSDLVGAAAVTNADSSGSPGQWPRCHCAAGRLRRCGPPLQGPWLLQPDLQVRPSW